ncbi:hypothetical protein NUACC21_05590 [Scytonema sp. NUACC21]
MQGHSKGIQAVTITSNGDWAISAADDCTLKVWDIENGKEIRTLTGHEDRVWGVAVTPDGKKVISASWDSSLKIWDLATGKEIDTLKGHNAQVLSVSVFPDGSKVVSVASDRTLKVWDLEKGKAIASFSTDSTLLTCTVAPDNTTIVAGDILGCVHILQLEGMDKLEERSPYPIPYILSHDR